MNHKHRYNLKIAGNRNWVGYKTLKRSQLNKSKSVTLVVFDHQTGQQISRVCI